MQRDVQRRVHRLAGLGDDLFVRLECVGHLEVLGLEQERALVLIVRIQPLQIEPLVRAMPSGHCPRPPVTRKRIVEPAVRRLLVLPRRHAPNRPTPRSRPLPPPRPLPRPRTPPRLAFPPPAGRPPATLRTHRTIVPDIPVPATAHRDPPSRPAASPSHPPARPPPAHLARWSVPALAHAMRMPGPGLRPGAARSSSGALASRVSPVTELRAAQPQRCDIVAVLSATMSHRCGYSRGRAAAVPGRRGKDEHHGTPGA